MKYADLIAKLPHRKMRGCVFLERNINELVAQMTLEEKAGLTSGQDFWHTKAVERLGIPSEMMTDGPHGLRKQESDSDALGLGRSVPATCFPTASALANSWDETLLSAVGRALGEEAVAQGVGMVLGPGVNIKRSPLCGRNFEYLSEDPYLAGRMASAYIRGVQSQGVGTSIKHFALNNQETLRMTISSEVSERALREIYLPAFEEAVKESAPRTVMCSYNKINGEYASENRYLLTDILRKEWGYKGCVVSDWGAVNNRVKGLQAGLDLEMPYSGGYNDRQIVKAVQEGRLDEAVLDEAVERVLNVVFAGEEQHRPEDISDKETDHKKAADIETECAVLLENNGILPLNTDRKVAYIGEFAEKPRYQGGGSSHINPFRVVSALDAAGEKGRSVTYAKGFSNENDSMTEQELEKALRTAAEADVAVIFAGLPEIFESEGYDRTSMKLPKCQDRLIEEVLKVQPNVVVVLHNGSPVELPWADRVSAILEMYLGGQGVGEACDRLLFGEANPSGRLSETFPYRLEDNPSFLHFPGNGKRVLYGEDIFVGYRYYDTKKVPVRYAFGHGLSYTEFTYGDLTLSSAQMTDEDILTVSLKVKNSGKTEGKEVVQLYVADLCGISERPVKELKGFAKVHLLPGEEKTVSMEISARNLSYYEERLGDWYAPSGTYRILIGHASDDIRLHADVVFETKKKLPLRVDFTTTFGELLDHTKTAPVITELLAPLAAAAASAEGMSDEYKKLGEQVIREMPLKSLLGQMPGEQVEQLIGQLNCLLAQ